MRKPIETIRQRLSDAGARLIKMIARPREQSRQFDIGSANKLVTGNNGDALIKAFADPIVADISFEREPVLSIHRKAEH